jgi:hypothetical protein
VNVVPGSKLLHFGWLAKWQVGQMAGRLYVTAVSCVKWACHQSSDGDNKLFEMVNNKIMKGEVQK